VEEIMKHIILNEGISIDAASQTYLLNKSHGSIRNVINNLEKIWVYTRNDPTQTITQYVCEKLCSTISFHQFEEYICALKNGDLKTAIQIFFEINDYGYSVIDILDYFYTFVKSTNRLTEEEKYQIIPFLCKYITIFNNTHEHCIELALFSNNLYSVFRKL
jgi:DNA polymerase III gamma/tau subunit